MMPATATIIAVAVLAGILLALSIYQIVVRLSARRSVPAVRAEIPFTTQQPVFLFDTEFLIDATLSASDLIANRAEGTSEFDAVIHLLQRQFPAIRMEVEALDDTGMAKVLTSEPLGLKVTLSKTNGLSRIALGGQNPQDHMQFADIERAAQTEELALLRNLSGNAPQMIWLESTEGELLWANSAYLSFGDELAQAAHKSKTVWPNERVFQDIPSPVAGDLTPKRHRYSVKRPGQDGEDWFDVTSVPQAGGVLHYASDANETVRAELAKRDFQQTLSKTFAQLSIGLAIFDRNRKLTMFNPAILDLTGLPVDFLSSRPSIRMVLDRLRETRMLPEPKDYTSWRDRFAELESAAENGNYCETWDLPDGQTFRVTGRPHPDGALAFLFEDISAEVLLTRRFRSEIQTGQAVLDALPEAIAVFSSAGTLVMSNEFYDKLWDMSDKDTFLGRDLRGSIRAWKSKCIPSQIWRDVEDVAVNQADRTPIIDTITLTDGRNASCQALPIEGGMTMVKFSISTGTVPAIRKLHRGDAIPRVVKT